MDDEEMVKKLAKSAQAFSDPIDFDKLIEDGLLVKKGRSYYALDIHALPKFYKESKSLKKLANKLSGYLD
jgi:predicted transcriptional regulator